MVFGFLGTSDILIILALALLLFGPTKLPEIGRQIGMAMRELRKMSSDVQRALDLDDYRYEGRYEPPSYPVETAPVGMPDDSHEAAVDPPHDGIDGGEHRDLVPGVRPWSVQEEQHREAEAPVKAGSEELPYAALPEQSTKTEATASTGLASVTTAEPPGPPGKQREA